MAATISAALKAHLQGQVTTIATCWKVTRKDGTTLGFTDHDIDILFESQNYEAATGMNPTAIASKSDMSVGNLDVESVLDSNSIAEDDIIAGKYDLAAVEIFIVNYEDLTQGRMLIKKGWIGEVTIKNGRFIAEVRDLNQKLSATIGDIFTASCSAILGDARCGVNLTSYTFNVTVTSVTNKQKFKASSLTQAAAYFSGGEVRWTSGNNDDLKMEIKDFRNTEVTLALPMPNDIQVGDSFAIIAGCDKTNADCKNKFNNLDNFRGFPHIPGTDKIFETAGTFN